MSTLLEINQEHPVIDALARNIAMVTAQPSENASFAQTTQKMTAIAALYAKQVAGQRDLMRVRLQTIFAYQKSVKEHQEVVLRPETILFCEELGVVDWRECPMDELLSFSREKLKAVKYNWLRSEIYRLIAQSELLTELSKADFEHMFADQTQTAEQ